MLICYFDLHNILKYHVVLEPSFHAYSQLRLASLCLYAIYSPSLHNNTKKIQSFLWLILSTLQDLAPPKRSASGSVCEEATRLISCSSILVRDYRDLVSWDEETNLNCYCTIPCPGLPEKINGSYDVSSSLHHSCFLIAGEMGHAAPKPCQPGLSALPTRTFLL